MEEGSFVRWQGRTINQFGYTTNLILGLAVASLGFSFGLLRGTDFTLFCWSKCFFVLSMFVQLISVFAGIFCSINRLRDFRKTTKVARMTEQGEGSQRDRDKLREETDRLGHWTWTLFYSQMWTFLVGEVLLVFALLMRYRAELF